MAVLVEAVSIIIRKDAIDRAYPGGWERFVVDSPNGTFCSDETLARIGFLTAAEAAEFVDTLEARGLVHLDRGEAADFSVVDQVRGPLEACGWLSFGGFLYGPSGRVAACWFCDNPWVHWGASTPDQCMQVATPEGWSYERSLSWALDAGKARRVRAGTRGAHPGGAPFLAMTSTTKRTPPLRPHSHRLH